MFNNLIPSVLKLRKENSTLRGMNTKLKNENKRLRDAILEQTVVQSKPRPTKKEVNESVAKSTIVNWVEKEAKASVALDKHPDGSNVTQFDPFDRDWVEVRAIIKEEFRKYKKLIAEGVTNKNDRKRIFWERITKRVNLMSKPYFCIKYNFDRNDTRVITRIDKWHYDDETGTFWMLLEDANGCAIMLKNTIKLRR